MTLVQLRYFQTVCKYSNITRAAAKLHISQPSLSSAVRELEEEFGFSLFYRLSRGLVLTEEGEQFLREADLLLKHADQFHSQMQALNRSAQTVRLGVSPMLSALIFPHLLQAYQETFPSSSLQLVENGSLSNRVLVLEGELDAAIVSCDGPLPPSLGFYDLCTVDISFYVSASHPLAEKASLELSDIGETPLVLLAEDSFLTSFMKHCFKSRNLIPHIVLNTNQLAVIQQLTEQNTAAAFLFDGALPGSPGIVRIPVRGLPEIQIRLIWNAAQRLSPGTQNLIRLARLEYLP